MRVWILGITGLALLVGVHALCYAIGWWAGGSSLAGPLLLAPGVSGLLVLLVYSVGQLVESFWP